MEEERHKVKESDKCRERERERILGERVREIVRDVNREGDRDIEGRRDRET